MAAAAPFGEVERTLAWRYLRARRSQGGVSLIAIISFVGIMLAVAALIIVMSVMSGFRATLLNALLGGKGHVFVMVDGVPSTEIDDLIIQIEGVEGVISAAPIIERQVLASTERSKTGAIVRGMRIEDMEKLPYLDDPITKAAADGFGEGRFGGDLIYSGLFLTEALFGRRDAETLKLFPYAGQEFRVVTAEQNQTIGGNSPRSKVYTIADTLQTGAYELDALFVFMPIEQAQILFNQRGEYDPIDVRIDDPLNPNETVSAIAELTGNRFAIDTLRRQRAQYFGALNTERAMMRLIMLLLITITALNIITGVVMLVKNKTRDIAILRTIGASQGSVMRVFIMVGATLGLAGATIGLIIGVAFVSNVDAIQDALRVVGVDLFPESVYGLKNLPTVLDWGEVGFTAAWAMGMSILVTLWPAWSAARLDPVDALRFE